MNSKTKTNYRIRFGRSLWSAISLPAQAVVRAGSRSNEFLECLLSEFDRLFINLLNLFFLSDYMNYTNRVDATTSRQTSLKSARENAFHPLRSACHSPRQIALARIPLCPYHAC